MAIYSFQMQVISRSKGRSATAAAAYRSGAEIKDERTGQIHDYTGKGSIFGSEILLPKNTPERFSNRATLWNEVEQTEKRKDAQLSREVMLALPVELSHAEKAALTRGYVQLEFVEQGMVADVCYHDFNSNNPHTHIMLTMRSVDEDGFGKKQRQWNRRSEIEQHRKAWADHANAALAKAGHDTRIDHRSLEAQGIEREPQIHLGAKVMEMEARGIHTRVGDESRRINQVNQTMAHQEAEYQQLLQQIEAEKIAALASSESASDKTPITEPLIPELVQPQEQQGRTQIAAAIVAEYLDLLGEDRHEGRHYEAHREEDYLVLVRRQDLARLMTARWDETVASWVPVEPPQLQAKDLENLNQLHQRVRQYKRAQREQRQPQSPQLEL